MKTTMKLLFLMLLASALLTACSEENETTVVKETPDAMFNFSASLPAAENQTRTVNISRYIVEIYNTSDLTTVVKRVEQASGTVVVALPSNTNYTCLFWADEVAVNENTTGTFNALDLKNVTLNTGKTMIDAFFARLDITDATTSFDVTLNRATAQVNIVTTATVTANTDLTVTFDQYRGFNTLASEVVGATTSSSKTFNSVATSGVLGSFLTFASVSGILTDFTSLYNSSITNEMKNTSLKANYITNIRGNYAIGDQEFTVIITVDEVWESVISGVDVNVGTVASPKWITVADRNAMKGGTHGATAGNGAGTNDYGYYYAWSNATNDPTNVDKAHRACFDFGEGNGFWRLPTQIEWAMISGNSGGSHTVNANRKLKWEAPAWKLYDERVGQESNFVYFPMAGINNLEASSSNNFGSGVEAAYWTSTATDRLGIFTAGQSIVSNVTNLAHWGFSVRCVRDI